MIFVVLMKLEDIQKYREELEEIKRLSDEKLSKLQLLEGEIIDTESKLKYVAKLVGKKLRGSIKEDEFVKFFEKPYVVKPEGRNKVLVFVPKFIKGFQAGWLWKEDETFYIYELDQYSAWLGDVPKELLEEINFKKEIEAEVEGNVILFDSSQKESIKKRLGCHIRDLGENRGLIKRGHEFDLIADMIESGCLPFKPFAVKDADKREGQTSINLRPYQKPAFDKFLETGAVGLFHPTGAGKSIVAVACLDIIKGKKLIIVPTKTLVEQWSYYIDKYLSYCKNEIEIRTYQGYRVGDDEFSLVVFDECQKLPADTFSRLALIKTKYRLGLSASPHREDGRESYIFALTGYPIGLNWKEYMETVGRKYHPVYVHVVRSESAKLRKAYSLIDEKKKTFVFCDSIELGRKLSNYLEVPFVYGQSEDRIETIEKNKILVVSRVMDLGVSVKDLEHIIEVDFLFGSRQQELQRTGRLMHSEKLNTRHDIIMTEREMESYGKRLWSLQERGFTIKVLS